MEIGGIVEKKEIGIRPSRPQCPWMSPEGEGDAETWRIVHDNQRRYATGPRNLNQAARADRETSYYSSGACVVEVFEIGCPAKGGMWFFFAFQTLARSQCDGR